MYDNGEKICHHNKKVYGKKDNYIRDLQEPEYFTRSLRQQNMVERMEEMYSEMEVETYRI